MSLLPHISDYLAITSYLQNSPYPLPRQLANVYLGSIHYQAICVFVCKCPCTHSTYPHKRTGCHRIQLLYIQDGLLQVILWNSWIFFVLKPFGCKICLEQAGEISSSDALASMLDFSNHGPLYYPKKKFSITLFFVLVFNLFISCVICIEYEFFHYFGLYALFTLLCSHCYESNLYINFISLLSRSLSCL